MAADREISWRVLREGTPVHSADGAELGQISSVVADDEKDIFSGIAFRPGVIGPSRFARAEDIAEMTEDRVVLTLTSPQAAELEDFAG